MMLSEKNLFSRIAFLLVSISLILYTYYRILNISSSEEELSAGIVTIQAVFLLIIEAISVIQVFYYFNSIITRFFFSFLLWVIWLLFDFFVIGLRGAGLSNVILALPCPFVFFYFYYLIKNKGVDNKRIILLFLIILVISGFSCITVMLSYKAVYLGNDPYVSNLIFWPLCTVPFIFLIKKPVLKWFFIFILGILVVLMAKRSAAIAFVLIVVTYLLYTVKHEVKNGKNRNRMIFGLIIIGLISFILVDRFFSSEVVSLSERFSSVREDEGSGRADIYNHVITQIQNDFTIDEYIVGRGYHSIVRTGHTNAHNDAMQVLYEYGIIGLFFYLVISIHAIKRLFYVRRFLPSYYPGYLASIIIYIVLGLFSNLYAYNTYFMFICAYWGWVEGTIAFKKGGFNYE